jgi:hypothetical protein
MDNPFAHLSPSALLCLSVSLSILTHTITCTLAHYHYHTITHTIIQLCFHVRFSVMH